jgi:hypothetical protein
MWHTEYVEEENYANLVFSKILTRIHLRLHQERLLKAKLLPPKINPWLFTAAIQRGLPSPLGRLKYRGDIPTAISRSSEYRANVRTSIYRNVISYRPKSYRAE